jgi:hypothetical protein
MSEETEKNIEIVKKGYEAFDTVMSLYDDNIDWVQPGESPISGKYHGKGESAGPTAAPMPRDGPLKTQPTLG